MLAWSCCMGNQELGKRHCCNTGLVRCRNKANSCCSRFAAIDRITPQSRLLNALVQELTLAAPKLPADIWEPARRSSLAQICILFPQVQQLLPAGQASTVQRAESHAPPNETAHDVSLGSIVQWLLELSHQQRLILCVDDCAMGRYRKPANASKATYPSSPLLRNPGVGR